MRKKNKIDVVFVITELSIWKTERLFQSMRNHMRFHPVIGITTSMEVPEAKRDLLAYVQNKGYEYLDLDEVEFHSPDIIFYQKPYDHCYKEKLLFYHHLNSLFCYSSYGLNGTINDWYIDLPLFKCAWMYYFETKLSLKFPSRHNVVTGVPMQDKLLMPKSDYPDPWKPCGNKKRIIYAPHHTIGDKHNTGLATSSFLENAVVMLELMNKYKHSVQWAFKPHPLLYSKLVSLWGAKKADDYYKQWRDVEHSQFENGEYGGLFMHSDAMIHDCVSFVIEYQYTHNPVLYLSRTEGTDITRTELAQGALDMHYKGETKDDIEKFIINVIEGKDAMKEQRQSFFEKTLIPPYGKTACQNIINAILGEEEYEGIV